MKKRFLAALIIFCMILALCPVSAFAGTGPSHAAVPSADRSSNVKRSDPHPSRAASVLTFTSDVHNKSGDQSANRLSGWLDNVINMYGKVDYMGFCGDMGDASANESNFWTYTQAVMDAVNSHNIPAVYTTGNHEYYNGQFGSTTNSVASNYVVGAEGANGSNFRIYALGTANWNNSSDNYTQAQVDALSSYLNSVDNSKPIIVLTHFPLHTASSSSGSWGGWGRTTANANLVIDALNEGAAAGKTIVLLWGHNHTISDTMYDEIQAPGYVITYASNSTKTIQFYYGAAGCMSDSEYGTGSAYVKGKGLVITVDGGALDFHYYDANGNDVTENVGEPGVTPTPTAVPTTAPGTTLPENGKTYVIVSSDGYALTSEGDTVGYTNGSSGSQQYNYTGLVGKAYTLGETVTTDLLWTFNTSDSGYTIKSQDGRYLNATYVSNSSGGYDANLKLDSVTDVWTVAGSYLRTTNGSQSDSGDKFLSHGNGTQSDYNMFCVRSEDNATTFVIHEYNSDGEYIGSEPTVTPTPTPVPGTTEIRYIETDSLTAGNDYILAVGDGSSVNAITYASSNATSTALTVTDNYIVTTNSNVVWNRTSEGYLKNGSNYLYPTSSNGIMTYSSGRAINYVNGHLAYETSSSGTYYLTYSNGFAATNNESEAATFRVFVKTEVSGGEPVITPTPTATPTPVPGSVTQVSGFENGKTYVIVANDGYALTCNDTDASFSNSGSGSQSYVYTGLDGVVFDQNSITADMLWTAQASGSGWNLLDQSGRYLNGIYESNGNGYNGKLAVNSTADVWTISSNKLRSDNASSGSSSEKFLTHGSGSSSNSVNVFTVRSSSSASTITIYEYNGSATPTEPTITPTPTPTPTATPTPTPGDTEIRYIETTTLEAGKDYVIAATNGENTVAAIAYSGSGNSITVETLNVVTGTGAAYVKTENENLVWNRTSDNFFVTGTRYLYPTSSSVTTYTSGRAISYADGKLSFTASSGTYYITFNGSTFGTSSSESSAASIRLFVKTEVESGDPSYLIGDVNFNGTVDASDAILIMRYTLNLITLSDLQLLAGDVNGNGTVDASDAIVIMRKVLGLIA